MVEVFLGVACVLTEVLSAEGVEFLVLRVAEAFVLGKFLCEFGWDVLGVVI